MPIKLPLFQMIVKMIVNYLFIYADKLCLLFYLWFLILYNILIFNNQILLIIDKNKTSNCKKVTP